MFRFEVKYEKREPPERYIGISVLMIPWRRWHHAKVSQIFIYFLHTKLKNDENKIPQNNLFEKKKDDSGDQCDCKL